MYVYISCNICLWRGAMMRYVIISLIWQFMRRIFIILSQHTEHLLISSVLTSRSLFFISGSCWNWFSTICKELDLMSDLILAVRVVSFSFHHNLGHWKLFGSDCSKWMYISILFSLFVSLIRWSQDSFKLRTTGPKGKLWWWLSSLWFSGRRKSLNLGSYCCK